MESIKNFFLNKRKQRDENGEERAYLSALASCIRNIEPGSAKHADLLWLIKHKDTILARRKLIELLAKLGQT